MHITKQNLEKINFLDLKMAVGRTPSGALFGALLTIYIFFFFKTLFFHFSFKKNYVYVKKKNSQLDALRITPDQQPPTFLKQLT